MSSSILLEAHDRFVSRDELQKFDGTYRGDAAVSDLIRDARQAVGDCGKQQQIIKTKYKRGYRFAATFRKVEESQKVEESTSLPTQCLDPQSTALWNEVRKYLEGLLERLTAVPSYFPAYLRTTPTEQSGFHTLRQEVQLLDNRAILKRWQADAQEHLRVTGYTDDGVAYAPYRARPEFDEDEIEWQIARPLSWSEASARFERAVILGDPGVGKSWLLRYEACRLAREALQDPTCSLDDIHLPIFLPLATLNQRAKMVEALLDTVIGSQYSKEYRGFVQDRLNTGQCTVLLDGLDELPTTAQPDGQMRAVTPYSRSQLRQILQEFAYDYPKPRLLLTSRPVGYTGSPIPGAQELELLAFDQEQIEHFVQAWFHEQPEHATQFLTQLRQQAPVRGLARIPLMLSLLCRSYNDNRLFPTRRVDLYDQCLHGLLHDWKEEDKKQDADTQVEAILELLQDVSYTLIAKGWEQCSARELRRIIHEWLEGVDHHHEWYHKDPTEILSRLMNDGILSTTGTDYDAPLMFLHRTFQEYLAARALGKRQSGVETAMEHVYDPAWEEVLRLLGGMVDQPMDYIMAFLQKNKEDLLCRPFQYAVLTLQEVASHQVPTELRHALLDVVMALYFDGDGLDLNSQQWCQLLVAYGEEVVPLLVAELKGLPFFTGMMAAEALGAIGGVCAVTALVGALKDSDAGLRRDAAAALATTRDRQAIGPLLDCLKDKDADVRRAAVRALEAIEDKQITKQTTDAIMKCLRDKDPQVRWAATGTLWTIWEREAVEAPQDLSALLKCLHDDDLYICLSAARALRAIKASDAAQILAACLEDADPEVRLRAVRVLEAYGGEHAVGALRDCLSDDEDARIRVWAAKALLEIENEKPRAVQALLDCLAGPDADGRCDAAEVLADIREPQAIEPLLLCLQDRIGCAGAAEALGRMQDSRAVAPLLEGLADPDVEIRASAAEALGMMGELSAIEKLLASTQGVNLQDSYLITGAVVEALLRMGSRSKQAIPVHAAPPAIRRKMSFLALVSTTVSALTSRR